MTWTGSLSSTDGVKDKKASVHRFIINTITSSLRFLCSLHGRGLFWPVPVPFTSKPYGSLRIASLIKTTPFFLLNETATVCKGAYFYKNSCFPKLYIFVIMWMWSCLTPLMLPHLLMLLLNSIWVCKWQLAFNCLIHSCCCPACYIDVTV